MNAPTLLDNRITVVVFAGMGGGCDGREESGFHDRTMKPFDQVDLRTDEEAGQGMLMVWEAGCGL